MTMPITDRIHHLQQLIHDTACRYKREAENIHLVAVSKSQPISAIREAFNAGLTEFGENYWQEAHLKISNLQELPIIWHFIGPLQSNKTAEIAKNFSWVHSVFREKTAQLLSQHRPAHLPPLNVCIQVNLDKEPNKSGILEQEVNELAKYIHLLPNLKLRGLMAIPRPCQQNEQQYESLLRLTHLLKQLNQQSDYSLDTLSMGMSDDLTAAIAAGSTMLRIGRGIFGERKT
jgi:pyridoxal phosphate enzyme (YggS family)